MIPITDSLWLGTASDLACADMAGAGITALLNVACDLYTMRVWKHDFIYAQCGLIEGPGSTPAGYHSAVLQLLDLLAHRRRVLVVNHDGLGRAVAVVIMAMHARERGGWEYYRKMIGERIGDPDYQPHEAHRKMFDQINWKVVMQLAGIAK